MEKACKGLELIWKSYEKFAPRRGVPLLGVAQNPSRRLAHLPKVLAFEIDRLGIDQHVVGFVFGILNGTQQRIGSPAQHDVEGMQVLFPLIEQGCGGCA